MKDLIEKILQYLPQYFLDYGSVFSEPKRFIASKDVSSNQVFSEACLFLTISIILVLFANASLKPPNMEFWSYVAMAFEFNALAVVLFGTITRVSWWIVGGKASAKSFFVTYMYFFGVSGILLQGLLILMRGLFKKNNRLVYDAMVAAATTGADIPNEVTAQISNLEATIFGIGLLLILSWCLVAWGAYRQINQLSRGRSFIAFMISFSLSLPALAAMNYIMAALRQ